MKSPSTALGALIRRRGRFGLSAALLASIALLLAACGSGSEESSTTVVAVGEGSSTTLTSEPAGDTSTTGDTSSSDTSTTGDTSTDGSLSGGNDDLGSLLGEEAGALPGLAGSASGSDALGPEVEACLGEQAAGLDSADTTAVVGGNLGDLSPSGRDIVTEAMNTCISGEDLGAVFATEFFKALGSDPSPEFTTCLSGELDGQAGDVIMEAASQSSGSDDIPQSILDMLDACGDTVIGDLFTQQFKEQGLTQAQATCISDAISGEITMSDLVEIGQGGSMPPDLESKITTAAQQCASAG